MPIPAHAWIAEPENVGTAAFPVWSFPWRDSPAQWKRARRLIPVTDTTTDRALGLATFMLRHNLLQEAGQAAPREDDQVIVPGCWIAITEGSEKGGFQPENATWWGFLSEVDTTTLLGQETGQGSVTALEIGHILDDSQVTGWAMASGDDAYGVPVQSPPTANISNADGSVIGNAIKPSSSEAYPFARNPGECGTDTDQYFSRWRLLNHLITYCIKGNNSQYTGPIDWPRTDIVIDEDLQSLLDDRSTPEVFDISEKNYRQVIDMCIPESLALLWMLTPVLSGGILVWQIDIVSSSILSPDTVNHPDAKATPENLFTDDPDETKLRLRNLRLSESIASQYDQIIIRCAPYLLGFTVGKKDYNFNQGWSFNQQDTYAEGAGESATEDEQKARRGQPDINAVGSRFTIVSESATQDYTRYYDIRTQREPITGGADLGSGTDYTGLIIPAIPQIIYDEDSVPANTDRAIGLDGEDSAVYCARAVSRAPYMPTARLSNEIPWPVGVGYKRPADNPFPDQRDAEAQSRPEYSKPVVLLYDDEEETWIDLLADDATERPQVSIDNSGLSIRIRYNLQEYLLENWKDRDGNEVDYNGVLSFQEDWKQLVVTVACESDQRLEITRDRPKTAATDLSINRQLVINRPDLACWVLRQGSVVGLIDEENPARPGVYLDKDPLILKDVVVRDDHPAAIRVADQAALWYFQDRRIAHMEIPITYAYPTWLKIGTMIGEIDDNDQLHTINTVIRSIKRVRQTDPRVEVQTSIPDMPEGLLVGGSASSPASGGPISLQMQGTPAQATARSETSQRVGSRDHRARLVIPPRGTAGGGTYYTLGNPNGNVVASYNGGEIRGIRSIAASSGIAEVPTSEPASGDTYADGLGYAFLDGVLVWCASAVKINGIPQQDTTSNVAEGQRFYSRGPVTLPVTGGGSAAVYLIFRA